MKLVTHSSTTVLVRALTLVACVLMCAPPASAQVEVSYDLGLFSHYVWRGITLTDGAVLQPAATITHANGASVNVWGNLDVDDANDMSGEFNELDLTFGYSTSVGKANLDFGFCQYTFPNTQFAGTQELYVGVGFDVPLEPSLTLYYDIDEVDDYYGTLGVSYGTDITDAVSWSLAASVGFAGSDFAAAYTGGTSSGLYDGNVSLGLEYAAEKLTFGVTVAYTDTLDEDVLTEQSVNTWGGVYLAASF